MKNGKPFGHAAAVTARCLAPARAAAIALCLTSAWAAAIALCLTSAWAAEPIEAAALLPDMNGWERDGEPVVYSPENLFEYIDGAADVYLTYEFEELAALTYDRGEKMSLSVEIYRHSDLRNAFGIYSQERPEVGDFISIGTQGYYEKGTLNFFHGRHYVKLMGYYLEDEDERILKDAAGEIAGRLGEEAAFPPTLECFPAAGKIPNSERFLAQDVLGHGFLHAAYAADYEMDGRVVRVFLIEGDDKSDASTMLRKYLELAGTGGPVIEESGTYRFDDPRRGSAERFNLRMAGRYLWGLSASDPGAADLLLDAIGKSLLARGLVE
jgi:hypothetical protein